MKKRFIRCNGLQLNEDTIFTTRPISSYKNVIDSDGKYFVHMWIAHVLSSWSIAKHQWFRMKSSYEDSEKFIEPLQIFARAIVLIQKNINIIYKLLTWISINFV